MNSTNCSQHQSSTKHDEKKYQSIAQNLRNEILRNFPRIKVYLKPLITEYQDNSVDSLYARSRLGAMEVQMYTNRDGNIEKKSIFSKLQTQKWPQTLNVLNQIREYLDKCTLRIEIIDEFFDPSKLSSNKKHSSENQLYNIEVILRPFRKNNQQVQTLQNQKQEDKESKIHEDNDQPYSFESTQQSKLYRSMYRINGTPMSAKSGYAVKSYSQLPQNKVIQPCEYSIEFREKSSPEGIVIFEKLPFDVYELEMRETNEYKSHKQKIDIFERLKEKQKKMALEQNKTITTEEKKTIVLEVLPQRKT